MSTPEIANYIRQARAQGMTDMQIQQQLVGAGWSQIDVSNAVQSMQMMHQAEEKKPPSIVSKIGAVIESFLRLVFIVLALVLLARFFASFALLFGKFDLGQFGYWQMFAGISQKIILVPITLLSGLLEKTLTTYNLNYFAGLDIQALLALLIYGLIYLALTKLVHKIFRRFM